MIWLAYAVASAQLGLIASIILLEARAEIEGTHR